MIHSDEHHLRQRLLNAYDAQLREEAEMMSATSFDRDGPLWRAKFGARGFVSYRDLGGLTGAGLDALIERTILHYAAADRVVSFEWKTRGHDAPPDLPERLVTHGFRAEEQETVMLGEAALLAVDVPLPPGVRLRRIDDQPEPMPDATSPKSGSPRRRVRWSAQVGSRSYPAPSSRACGAAGRCPSGAAGASTGR